MAGTVAMLLNLFSQELVSWSYLAKNLYLVIIKASESLDYSRFINICKNVSELVVALYRIKMIIFFSPVSVQSLRCHQCTDSLCSNTASVQCPERSRACVTATSGGNNRES